MNWFIENCTPANIGILLAFLVLLWGAWKWLEHAEAAWLAELHTMEGPAGGALIGDQDGHTTCIVDDMTEQDLDDLQRGTKLQ